jgi:hypothetical protein
MVRGGWFSFPGRRGLKMDGWVLVAFACTSSVSIASLPPFDAVSRSTNKVILAISSDKSCSPSICK